MIRQRWFGVAVAIVAVLALLVLFLPGAAFAQDADANPAGNGQYGQAMRGNGNGRRQMDGANNAQVYANASNQGGRVGYGHAGADHSMMGSAGMASHAQMGGMMHGTTEAGAMHQGQGAGLETCPGTRAHGQECVYQVQAATSE